MVNNFAFIDSQNVHLAIRDQGWTLDWTKFRRYLKDKYAITTAFAFIGYVPGNESLYTYLQRAGFIVIHKPTLAIRKGKETIIKGNVDAELVLHTMIEWNQYERALIISGDGDFHCLVEHLLAHEKLLHLMIPNARKYSALLRDFRESIVYMNELKSKIGRDHKTRGSILRTKP